MNFHCGDYQHIAGVPSQVLGKATFKGTKSILFHGSTRMRNHIKLKACFEGEKKKLPTATKNPKSKKQQKPMNVKNKNAVFLLASRSIPQQRFFSSLPQCIFSLSQAVPSTVKTSSFSSVVTQQKILYFRGREKAVQLLLLYSSLSAAHCLAPHTSILPASLAHQHSSPQNDSPLYYPFRRKYELMEPIWLKTKRIPLALWEQAVQCSEPICAGKALCLTPGTLQDCRAGGLGKKARDSK